ncbi:hypothetical protein BIW11_13783 [Tropilaelaps mercedesae]|uniref:Uncharacterized protein n=1 Tax=Tropilaelaps mercedesae TaxID=418985 RepID=A0A1V9X139_9ACAR|nr:hypothetical protein BIW11_13783 [Tropilaelaps mercedesae]
MPTIAVNPLLGGTVGPWPRPYAKEPTSIHFDSVVTFAVPFTVKTPGTTSSHVNDDSCVDGVGQRKRLRYLGRWIMTSGQIISTMANAMGRLRAGTRGSFLSDGTFRLKNGSLCSFTAAGRIMRIDPNTVELLTDVQIPATKTTSCLGGTADERALRHFGIRPIQRFQSSSRTPEPSPKLYGLDVQDVSLRTLNLFECHGEDTFTLYPSRVRRTPLRYEPLRVRDSFLQTVLMQRACGNLAWL